MDSSAIKMSQNDSDNDLLKVDPFKLYSILTDDGQIEPDFILLQGKYLHFTHRAIPSMYKITTKWEHSNIFEQIFLDYDMKFVMERRDGSQDREE